MKQGKLPENVLKRSVFKQLHTKRKDVLLSAGVGEDCAAFTLKEDEVAVLSTDPVIWENSLDGRYAVHANLNDLATSGAEPIGLMLTAMLPADIKEAQIPRNGKNHCGGMRTVTGADPWWTYRDYRCSEPPNHFCDSGWKNKKRTDPVYIWSKTGR